MKINILGNHYLLFTLSKGIRMAGHESIYFQETGIHPWHSIAWEHHIIDEEDFKNFQEFDFLGVSPLSEAGKSILNRLSDSDIIICMGMAAYWAVLCNKPLLYISFGGDVSRWPFRWESPQDREHNIKIRSVLAHASKFLGILHAKRHRHVVERLMLPKERIFSWMQPIDCDRYEFWTPEHRMEAKKRQGIQDGEFILFIPSQLQIEKTPIMNFSKGIDIFLQGIKRLRETHDHIRLWITDRGCDKYKVRQIINDMGLAEITEWLPPCGKQTLIERYNISDVVLDQIFPDIGNHGTLTLEAMATGTPVCSYIDHEYRASIGEPHIPNINVQRAEDVAESLSLYIENQELYEALCIKSRAFVVENHSVPVCTQATLALAEGALSESPVSPYQKFNPLSI